MRAVAHDRLLTQIEPVLADLQFRFCLDQVCADCCDTDADIDAWHNQPSAHSCARTHWLPSRPPPRPPRALVEWSPELTAYHHNRMWRHKADTGRSILDLSARGLHILRARLGLLVTSRLDLVARNDATSPKSPRIRSADAPLPERRSVRTALPPAAAAYSWRPPGSSSHLAKPL